jgi:prephenate dehydratase
MAHPHKVETHTTPEMEPLGIGYLGPEGSHSFQATEALLSFWKHSLPETSECLHALSCKPYPNFISLLEAVTSKQLSMGVLPIENALEGSVVEVMEAIGFQTFPVKVQAEFRIPIQHCLIRQPGTEQEPVLKVLSHPMALAQCRQTLYRRFGHSVQTLQTASTAEAVQMIQQQQTITSTPVSACVAIGTRAAASLHQLSVEAEDLSDVAGNETRFLLVTHQEGDLSNSLMEETRLPWQHYPQKTMLCFDLEDRPGALVDVLTVFQEEGINLTKIESRPTRKGMGSYVFFIDTDRGRISLNKASENSDSHKSPIDRLQKQTTFLNCMGPFPSLPRLKLL